MRLQNKSNELPKWALEGNLIARKVIYNRYKENIDTKTNGFSPASYLALDVISSSRDLKPNQARRWKFLVLVIFRDCKTQGLLHWKSVFENMTLVFMKALVLVWVCGFVSCFFGLTVCLLKKKSRWCGQVCLQPH